MSKTTASWKDGGLCAVPPCTHHETCTRTCTVTWTRQPRTVHIPPAPAVCRQRNDFEFSICLFVCFCTTTNNPWFTCRQISFSFFFSVFLSTFKCQYKLSASWVGRHVRTNVEQFNSPERAARFCDRVLLIYATYVGLLSTVGVLVLRSSYCNIAVGH